MTVTSLPILLYPDPRLRQDALPIERVTPEIQHLIDELAETMYAAPAVGIAAPQVGEFLRLFLVDMATDDEPSNLLVFINPEITEHGGERIAAESCLSCPGVSKRVRRASGIKGRALDRQGVPFVFVADGSLAAAIQHEIDHLNGVLLIDHLATGRADG